jgi:hypothetical protein
MHDGSVGNANSMASVEWDTGFTLAATRSEVRTACADVALDMGLELTEDGENPLILHDPFRLPPVFTTDLCVKLSGDDGDVHVYVLASGGGGVLGRDYVRQLAEVFRRRLEAEMQPSSEGGLSVRHRLRRLLTLFFTLQWLPVAALVPIAVIPRALHHAHAANIALLVWVWLLFVLPPVVEVIRRRVIGTNSASDYAMLGSILVGVAATAFFALAGVI